MWAHVARDVTHSTARRTLTAWRRQAGASLHTAQTEMWDEYFHRRAEYVQTRADQWKMMHWAESALQQAAS